MDDEHEPEPVGLDDLDLKDWAEIKSLARQMYTANHHGGDQLKCAIHGFFQWLKVRDKSVFLEDDFEFEIFH